MGDFDTLIHRSQQIEMMDGTADTLLTASVEEQRQRRSRRRDDEMSTVMYKMKRSSPQKWRKSTKAPSRPTPKPKVKVAKEEDVIRNLGLDPDSKDVKAILADK